uniref:Secreted protein n=1 Tax=Steinernema glaseri TaxID=37863 RepID=A0A1I8AIC7_9BILA
MTGPFFCVLYASFRVSSSCHYLGICLVSDSLCPFLSFLKRCPEASNTHFHPTLTLKIKEIFLAAFPFSQFVTSPSKELGTLLLDDSTCSAAKFKCYRSQKHSVHVRSIT